MREKNYNYNKVKEPIKIIKEIKVKKKTIYIIFYKIQ